MPGRPDKPNGRRGEVWKAPRTVAAWQAVGSEVVHDEAPTEEGQVTRALRDAIKELVSAHGAGPQADVGPLFVLPVRWMS